ncbi:MAG TPA: arylamine N-acetyltransferase [Meiothermus sp.]|jgi:N-hydroxyarylamine O-acetyltransferase|nr:arylamine N-acetyltransferase [Meiothermus sp.]
MNLGAYLEPIPFREGTYRQNGFEFRLEPGPEDERWTVHNHLYGAAPTYDFGLDYALSDFWPRCEWLQTSPDSGFVRTTVCQRFTPESILTLRGAVFKTLALEGASQHVLKTEEEYKTAMAEVFGLEVDTSKLWPRVWARHLDWVRSQEAI